MAKIIERISMEQIARRFRFPLPVKCIGRATVCGDRYRGNHWRNIEFCIRLKGDELFATDRVGERVFQHRFPHLFVKQPPFLHRYEYKGEREAIFIIYSIELKPVFESMGIDFGRTGMEFAMTPGIGNLLFELQGLFDRIQTPGTADEIDTLSWAIIQKIWNCGERAEPAKKNNTLEKIHAIASYLELHYLESPDLGRLAQKHGLSRRNFYRYWGEYFAVSPLQKIQELKILEAKRLLENQSLGIAEIAESLHYIDSAYFVRVFRKNTGMTPLQYRKVILEALENKKVDAIVTDGCEGVVRRV